jgi:predicted HicB family RNase H-like nuclease
MMQYKDYIGKVEFDPDAKVLHGEVVGIRDVVTFQGDSVREVEKAFRESVDDYLAFCKERGEQPDKSFSGQFVLRLDADLHRRLNMLAQAEGKSLNAFVMERLSRDAEQMLGELTETPKSSSRRRKSA